MPRRRRRVGTGIGTGTEVPAALPPLWKRRGKKKRRADRGTTSTSPIPTTDAIIYSGKYSSSNDRTTRGAPRQAEETRAWRRLPEAHFAAVATAAAAAAVVAVAVAVAAAPAEASSSSGFNRRYARQDEEAEVGAEAAVMVKRPGAPGVKTSVPVILEAAVVTVAAAHASLPFVAARLQRAAVHASRMSRSSDGGRTPKRPRTTLTWGASMSMSMSMWMVVPMSRWTRRTKGIYLCPDQEG